MLAGLRFEQRQKLEELPKLLMTADFRAPLLERNRNQDIVDFFQQRFEQWGESRSLESKAS